MRKVSLRTLAVLMTGAALFLAGCEREEYDPKGTAGEYEGEPTKIDYASRNTIFGKGGLNLFGSDTNDQKRGGGSIGVNVFLWRASLDTLAFMPVNTADSFGGVILTDWHTPADAPSERFKLNVYILGRTLRADGIRVAVFRQIQDGAGSWRDAAVPEETGIKIEDAILLRARQLRHQSAQQ